jgi:hypothetical protein
MIRARSPEKFNPGPTESAWLPVFSGEYGSKQFQKSREDLQEQGVFAAA